MKNLLFEEDIIYKREEQIRRIDEVESEFSMPDNTGLFTTNELKEHDGWRYQKRHLAGKYLVKKIISGYLKMEMCGMIEVLNAKSGKPEVMMNDFLKEECTKSGIKGIMVSISHSKHFITAMAVFEYDKDFAKESRGN
jgi:phosphopantetheinyl transferase (holo-ACP synthase)